MEISELTADFLGGGVACARLLRMEQPLWPSHWTALSELHFAVVRADTKSTDGRFITRLCPYTHDEDGDMIVPRRGDSAQAADEDVSQILLLHAGETSMAQVGLQLWSGALVLTEYILAQPALFNSRVVLELGAGLALPSLCAAKAGARQVYATDYADDILANCTETLALNTRYLAGATAPVVRRLDWLAKDPFAATEQSGPYGWKEEDRTALLGDVVIIAADVVYDEKLTDGVPSFLRYLLTMQHCMGSSVNC